MIKAYLKIVLGKYILKIFKGQTNTLIHEFH